MAWGLRCFVWALDRNWGTKRRKRPIGLFNHLTAHVGLQSFGNADAFGRLEVLEERGHNAGQGERRSVECVAKLDLFVFGTTIAAVKSVGLVAIEVRNGADSIVFQTKKALTDVGSQISDSDKATVEADLKALEDVLAANPLEGITKDGAEQIKAAQEKLMQSSQALFTKVYEQAQAAGAAGAADATAGASESQSGNADDNVVDGDFKEV